MCQHVTIYFLFTPEWSRTFPRKCDKAAPLINPASGFVSTSLIMLLQNLHHFPAVFIMPSQAVSAVFFNTAYVFSHFHKHIFLSNTPAYLQSTKSWCIPLFFLSVSIYCTLNLAELLQVTLTARLQNKTGWISVVVFFFSEKHDHVCWLFALA